MRILLLGMLHTCVSELTFTGTGAAFVLTKSEKIKDIIKQRVSEKGFFKHESLEMYQRLGSSILKEPAKIMKLPILSSVVMCLSTCTSRGITQMFLIIRKHS